MGNCLWGIEWPLDDFTWPRKVKSWPPIRLEIRRVRQSLDAESAATLGHAFVTSRVDYCNAVLAGSPKVTTDKLQRVINSAARVVSNLATLGSSIAACCGYCTTNSTDSMSPTEYDSSSPCWCTDAFMELLRCTWRKVAHKQPTSSVVNICGPPVSWLYGLCSVLRPRQHSIGYMGDAGVSWRWSRMIVPRYRLDSYGRRCFAVAGPSTWTSLSDSLRDQALSLSIFMRHLKTRSQAVARIADRTAKNCRGHVT